MVGRMPSHFWLDAHLDLAYLAVNGRDMSAPTASCGGPHPPAAVTLASLQAGGVVGALGTIFTEAGGDGVEGYPAGDWETAARKGRAQLEVYLTWRDEGHILLQAPPVVDSHLGEMRAGLGVARVAPRSPTQRQPGAGSSPPLYIGVLIENADPIRSPLELPWWIERGVVAIGLTWSKSSRFAGGNAAPGVGLSAEGREMIRAMDELNVIHDLSHFSQRATDELLTQTDRLVIASHSNPRALLADNERHITDETIREVGRRGGVVGLNLITNFLNPSIAFGSEERATIDDCVRIIEHVCDVMNSRTGVGLGSDMDGGVSAKHLPEGINEPVGLTLITEALARRGWSEQELFGFRYGNFARALTAARTLKSADAE